MSTLADIENALVEILAALEAGGDPVFKAVRSVTGEFRPQVRDALLREVTPAAYVAFLREPTDPRTPLDQRGPQFAIWIAARAPGPTADPRHGSAEAAGAFDLIAYVREALDEVEIVADYFAQPIETTVAFADERVALYALRYRLWPEPEAPVAPGPPTDAASSNENPGGSFILHWTAPPITATEGLVDYYRIYRKRPAESGFSLLDTAGKQAEEKLLTGQPTGETLQYYLTAANDGGEGTASNTVVVML